MTSPGFTPPEGSGVYTVGSRFGQDLTAESAKRLVRSPDRSKLDAAASKINGRFGRVVNYLIAGVSSAIKGDKYPSTFERVADAMNERIDSVASTDYTEEFDRIRGEVSKVQDKQGSLVDDMRQAESDFRGLQQAFNKEQVKFNDFTQEQIELHQDVLEWLDVRTPRVYSPDVSRGEYKTYRISGNDVSGNVTEYPLLNVLFPRFTARRVYIIFKGSWTGKVTVTCNWNSGATDVYSVKLNSSAPRVAYFEAGGLHLRLRSITIECYPETLGRKAYFHITPSTKRWELVDDKGGLFRRVSDTVLRTRGAVLAVHGGVVRDGFDNRHTLKPYTSVSGVTLHLEDFSEGHWHFLETPYTDNAFLNDQSMDLHHVQSYTP